MTADKFLKEKKDYQDFREKLKHHAQITMANYFHNVRYKGQDHTPEKAEKELLSQLEKIAVDHGYKPSDFPNSELKREELLNFYDIDENTFFDYISSAPDTIDPSQIVNQLDQAYNRKVQQNIAITANKLDDKVREEIIKKGIGNYAPKDRKLNMGRAITDQNFSQFAVNYVLGEGKVNDRTAKSLKIWDKYDANK